MSRLKAKNELLIEAFNIAYGKTHRGFFSNDYYRLNTPKELKMDDGSVVKVEWVQPSYWSTDVLINYQSDHLFAKNMSEKELKQLIKII